MSGGEGDGVDVMDDGPPEGWGVDWCHVAHEMQVRNAELMFKIDDQQEKIEELEAKVGGSLMQSSDGGTMGPTEIVVNEVREAKITQLAKKVRIVVYTHIRIQLGRMPSEIQEKKRRKRNTCVCDALCEKVRDGF